LHLQLKKCIIQVKQNIKYLRVNKLYDKLIFGGDIMKLKRFLLAVGVASSVLIASCGGEAREEESWEEMSNQF